MYEVKSYHTDDGELLLGTYETLGAARMDMQQTTAHWQSSDDGLHVRTVRRTADRVEVQCQYYDHLNRLYSQYGCAVYVEEVEA